MNTHTLTSITLDAADRLVNAALRCAEAAGVSICVAVVDRSGHLLAFKRHPLAPLHSIEIAQDKAWTALSFKRPTGHWQAILESRSEMLRHGLMQRPRFVGFGGGLPIEAAGELIGAIGISGGSEAQDVAFAEAALAEIGG